jgi:tellurite resistance protein
MSAGAKSKLQHLMPGWYALVMGLAGLSLAWQRAQPLLGDAASAAALAIGALAASVFAVLLLASIVRGVHHPEAWAEDRRHPVRHAFIAALPISLLLLATVDVAQSGVNPIARGLWWIGSLMQWAVTLWVVARWWRGAAAGGLQWAGVTPALFIPIVGNVLVPLAGVPLGHAAWAAAQFGVGLLFWPLVLTLLVVRIVTQGLWTERLLPTAFIVVAPPAVVGLALLQFGASPLMAWACWGIALFSALWAAALARRIAALPFGLPHWGMSFPLAALAALTLRLGEGGDAMSYFGLLVLALATLVIAGLLLGTVRGLRDGSLLAPETAAPGAAASVAPAAATMPALQRKEGA